MQAHVCSYYSIVPSRRRMAYYFQPFSVFPMTTTLFGTNKKKDYAY